MTVKEAPAESECTIRGPKNATTKGDRSIPEKRGLGRWDEFKAKNKHWKTRRGGNPAYDDAHMFAAQPDFAKAGHLFALYPKYHYESNWIEGSIGNRFPYVSGMLGLSRHKHVFLCNTTSVLGVV
ncbi:hypothetical protein DFQ30_001561 [Apophysomyces sp. BC1015]|nr:hypothetical protein DFQ30_001561 [Apophysomyces sp. BC1015]KAG0183524.1 hypothetical protein DFQ29_002578 [Apophysomyces sp. BC1021]